ncbi:hypothetical protein AB0I60_14810 [Actinosynnema sp. NPDC050436]|uniref:hypothetical protein n=1 Tax=Actinosynnema sp. NPDC050436 TaxID=3155659 RepID=UPI0033D8E853
MIAGITVVVGCGDGGSASGVERGSGVGDPPTAVSVNAEIDGFLESATETRPLTEFTDWEWDEVYVFDLRYTSGEKVNEVVGWDIAPGFSSGGGALAFYRGEKVVRYEVSGARVCEGIYTRSAYVDPKYGCWLRDENKRPFEQGVGPSSTR